MSRFRLSLVAAVAITLSALPLVAQVAPPAAPAARTSPHEVINAIVDGNYQAGSRVTVVYGRPFSKAPRGNDIRKVWGALIPWNAPWRMGSDEATLFITEATLTIGTATIPPGAYSLYMLPVENGTSKLIINKKIGQWGTVYDEKQDLVRVDLKKEDLTTQIDQFIMAVTPKQGGGGGTLKLAWEKTQYSVEFAVKK